MFDLSQVGLILNSLGALTAGIVQIPYSHREVIKEAGIGIIGADTKEEQDKMPSVRRVKCQRWFTAGVLRFLSTTGWELQLANVERDDIDYPRLETDPTVTRCTDCAK